MIAFLGDLTAPILTANQFKGDLDWMAINFSIANWQEQEKMLIDHMGPAWDKYMEYTTYATAPASSLIPALNQWTLKANDALQIYNYYAFVLQQLEKAHPGSTVGAPTNLQVATQELTKTVPTPEFSVQSSTSVTTKAPAQAPGTVNKPISPILAFAVPAAALSMIGLFSG